MAEGKGRESWNHTSCMLAMIANIMRSKGQRMVKPAELNPYTFKPKAVLRGSDLRILKDIFVKEEPNGNVRRH